MIAARDKILSQIPFNRNVTAYRRIEIDEITVAIEDVHRKGLSGRGDARIAAFAWISGVAATQVLELFRNRGTARILRDELKDYKDYKTSDAQSRPPGLLARAGRFSLAENLGIPELGWMTALLSVAMEADFTALIELLDPKDDPLRIIARYLASQPFILPEHRSALMGKLITLEDDLSRELAIILFTRWVEEAVLHQGTGIEDILRELEKNKIHGAAIIGSVLEPTARFQMGHYPSAIVERAKSVQDLLDTAGKRVIVDSRTVTASLKYSGFRAVHVLAAMSRWREDADFARDASRALGRKAREILDQQFTSYQNITVQEVSLRRSFGGAWSINPLVNALRHDGMEVDIFWNYFDSLATDSLSQMTRYGIFLEDRHRAIALLAVAGLIAHETQNHGLLEAVKRGTERLRAQPRGVVEAISASSRQQLEQLLGIEFPEK
jgi:hypothetical protein